MTTMTTTRAPRRWPWVVLGVMAVLAIGFTAAAAVVVAEVARGEWISVRVVDRGSDPVTVDLAFPGALAGAAVHVAPHLMPVDERRRVERELARLGPGLAALAAELEAMPDALLVEVEDGDERVEVRKRGEALRVSVRSPDADVDVTVPVALLRHAVDAFDG